MFSKTNALMHATVSILFLCLSVSAAVHKDPGKSQCSTHFKMFRTMKNACYFCRKLIDNKIPKYLMTHNGVDPNEPCRYLGMGVRPN